MATIKILYKTIFYIFFLHIHTIYGDEGNLEMVSDNPIPLSNDGNEKIYQESINTIDTIKNFSQSAMDGAKNVMNMVPESYMNDLSNITNGISSEDVNEAVNSIYPIVANVISQKGKLNYQAIASKWISVNPKLSDKIIMIMEFIANKTKSLPQVDQDFLAKWSQYNQDVLDKLSKGEINEEELNDIYKKSLEDLIAIPENDRKEFDTVVPGLGTLLVDSEFVDKINAAISNITEESMREINKYIFSKIINLTITTPTPSPLN